MGDLIGFLSLLVNREDRESEVQPIAEQAQDEHHLSHVKCYNLTRSVGTEIMK